MIEGNFLFGQSDKRKLNCIKSSKLVAGYNFKRKKKKCKTNRLSKLRLAIGNYEVVYLVGFCAARLVVLFRIANPSVEPSANELLPTSQSF